jgi:hypothetical protein
MTLMDTTFRYKACLGPQQSRAIDSVREVYGIRRLSLDEIGRTVRVEYDASRLGREDVRALLREPGLDINGVAERGF